MPSTANSPSGTLVQGLREPKITPKRVEISELDNGFTVHISGGKRNDEGNFIRKTLVAKTTEEAMNIAEGHLMGEES